MRKGEESDSTVLKAPSSRPIALLVWAGCATLVVWFVARSDWEPLGISVPWLLLVAWTVYIVLWLPRLILQPDGLTVVNGLRTHRIPFNVVEDVNVGHSVSISADGRKIVSWGAPMPRGAMAAGREVFAGSKFQTITPGNDRLRAAPAVDPARDRIVKALERARVAQKPGASGAVETRWHTLTVAFGVLVVLTVVGLSVLS